MDAYLLIIGVIVLMLFLILIRKKLFLVLKHNKAEKKLEDLRFLYVRIPQKSVSKSSDLDADDHVQNMKQNLEIMNQIYKNFYSIYDDSWSSKRFVNNYISMEIFSTKEQIQFVLGVPSEFLENVMKIISGFYPGSVVDTIKQPIMLEAGKYMGGGELILKKNGVFPIKTYEEFEADPMDSILSSYSKIMSDERLGLQILVSPLSEKWMKNLRKKSDEVQKVNKGFFGKIFSGFGKLFFSKDGEETKNEEEEKNYNYSQTQTEALGKKVEDELFEIKIRMLATSTNSLRPKKIINDMVRSFSQYSYTGLNNFKFLEAKNIRNFAKEYVSRIFFSNRGIIKNLINMNKKNILNTKEISSIYHFPHSRFNKNPRISWQKYKVVPAPDNLPDEGMLLGYNTYGGNKKEVKMEFMDRFRHVYIVGQTGTGKTTLMLLQAVKDMRAGHGFCYLDPHGDFCEDLLSYIPKERIDDLIYFDLSNTQYPIGFNPLVGDNEDERDIITNDLVEMFENMYGPEIFGPRLQDYFRHACFLLMEQPEGGTLVDIMRLFTDDAYAESKIRNVKNPVIASWWNKTYKKMGDREKAEAIPFFQAKFAPFTTGIYVRNIVGQPKPAFDLFDAMQEGKIILCNLSKGLAGEINSQLIGRMLVMQIKIAALRRAKIAQDERQPFFLYIDEFQNYVSKSIESILSEARKYRLGLTVAHQYIEQLKQSGLSGNIDLSTAIFGNIGTIFAMKVGAPDAEFLEKEFSPEFTQNDLINMDKFKGIMKMSVDSQQSRPFSFQPLYIGDEPPANTKEKVEIIKQISALKWGTKRELVDKEIYYRVGV